MSKLKKLLVTSLSAALLGAALIPVTGAMIKATATEDWSKVDIDQEYLVDETLNIPARTLTVGGETRYIELVNLILGRAEVAKSEILAIVSLEEDFFVKKERIDGVFEKSKEYFESVMAQR